MVKPVYLLSELTAWVLVNKLVAALVILLLIGTIVLSGYLSVRQTQHAINELKELCDVQFGQEEYLVYSCPCKGFTLGACYCCASKDELQHYQTTTQVPISNLSVNINTS